MQAAASRKKASPSDGRLLLNNVPWESYRGVGRLLADQNLRITYHKGTLEIRPLPPEQEERSRFLIRLLEAVFAEMALEVRGFGSAPCQSVRADMGLQPDACWYVAKEGLMAGRDGVDLERDPPPDLALEVDGGGGKVDRLAVYAGLGIPEVWRWDGKQLTLHRLDKQNGYRESQTSQALTGFPGKELQRFFKLSRDNNKAKVLRDFRVWIREKYLS